MVDALERFLTDPEYASSMGKAVRKRANEMMDPVKLDQHERETYLDLLARSREQQIRENIEFHDKTANDYASTHGEIFNDIEQERLSMALKESLKAVKTGSENFRALDYGCGSGNITKKLLSLNINVVAADVSSHFLALVLKQSPGKKLSTLKLNGKDLANVEADSFDFISVYSVLHHIPDYLGAIIELARVCKPGGIIYVDHEHNDEYFSETEVYKDFKSKVLRINWNKYFTLSNYINKARKWVNPRYASEGDIHVWKDDHIEFQQIADILMSMDFEVVLSKDYLSFNKLYHRKIYDEYQGKCTDVRLMAFRKC
jgi:ubiquinone/menaquinone biosynthesis C-methylase UbiE